MTSHFAFPFRLDRSGRFATVEQDSVDEISQCVAVVLSTPEGSRLEVPDFGVPRLDFHTPDPDAIIAAVAEWEPRADLDLDVLAPSLGEDPSIATIRAAIRPHVAGEDAL